jgi:hypothetical protein
MTTEPIPTAEEVRELAAFLDTLIGYPDTAVRQASVMASTTLRALLSQRDTALKERDELIDRGARLVEECGRLARELAAADARSETLQKERDEAVRLLKGMLRLSKMGFEESLKEPEENGNFAVFEHAAAFLSSLQPQGVKASEGEG